LSKLPKAKNCDPNIGPVLNVILLEPVAGSPALAAAQLFTDAQTCQAIIAIPILTPNARFLSSSSAEYLRPAFKVQVDTSLGFSPLVILL
jgi:hypothetical protein